MRDLISRQAAIDRINKQREHLQPDIYPQDKIGDAAYRICTEFIERLPSAQPEQKKGRWVEAENKWGGIEVICSECGEEIPRDGWGNAKWCNYCPNCGARMLEGEEDE